MRLSSMADYAVVTMCAAARHCGTARVSASDLADETGLPAPTVQKLVSLLGRAGLLRSKKVKQWVFYRRDEERIARARAELGGQW